jgi:hypothetical protein
MAVKLLDITKKGEHAQLWMDPKTRKKVKGMLRQGTVMYYTRQTAEEIAKEFGKGEGAKFHEPFVYVLAPLGSGAKETYPGIDPAVHRELHSVKKDNPLLLRVLATHKDNAAIASFIKEHKIKLG